MTGQVDRGPEGLQVLTFVRNLTWSFPRNVLALIGPLAVWDDVVSVASGFGLLPRKILKEITAIDWGRFLLCPRSFMHARCDPQVVFYSRKSRLVLPRRLGPARRCC